MDRNNSSSSGENKLFPVIAVVVVLIVFKFCSIPSILMYGVLIATAPVLFLEL